MRGQGSMEYMLIVSAFFLIISTVTLPQFYSPAQTMGDEVGGIADARYSAEEISKAVNTISHDTTVKETTTVHNIPLNRGWTIRIENDKQPSQLVIQVPTSRGLENIKSDLMYSFKNLEKGGLDNEIEISQSGPFAVIVKQNFEKKEGFEDSYLDNDKLYIYMDRGW